MSPNVFNVKLWETSGHLKNYRENLFEFQVEKEGWGMKPMNCPGHCVVFDSKDRSYKELPIRMAEFGVLHRNEASGALSGLTRVRRFVQDDAHIFCTPEQIEQEMAGVIDLLKKTYGLFGFPFTLELSTRPEKFLGEIAVWDAAEEVRRELAIATQSHLTASF
jgi:threonyl-tRNA synthetase